MDMFDLLVRRGIFKVVPISARHEADNWNKIKNLASKAIGDKMKVELGLGFLLAPKRS
jgi:hypothetical protein